VAFSTLEKLLLGAVGMDVIAPGTSRKVVEATIARAFPKGITKAPVAGRPITGMQAARIGLGPTALAAGYYYTGLAAQDQARRDLEQYGEPRVPIPLWNPLLGDMPTIDVGPIDRTLKAAIRRKPSNFNKAISAGMKAVRSSKFMGKPKSISNSKKAFATVTKTVSAMKKGRKRPTKGVRGAIARAARRYI
jgi:hypothetical protein